MDTLEYVTELNKYGNLNRKPLDPIWMYLKKEFNVEYNINKKEVSKANIEFRKKKAKRWIISWLIARSIEYDDIKEGYRVDFAITRYEYEKEYERQKLY